MLDMQDMMDTGLEESRAGDVPFHGGRGDWLRGVAVVAGLAGVVSLMGWCQGAEGRAIQAMPEPERRALYARTLENLATVCVDAPDGMHDYCEGEARLALEFSECEQSCQALAARHISRVFPRR